MSTDVVVQEVNVAHRRGRRWVASGYERSVGRKKHLGTYMTKNEAVRVEADWKLRTQATGRETCDSFASRWARDYPRPRASTNVHNAERVAAFARDFRGVKLADVDRQAARAWALKHRHHLPAVRAMFSDALRDGITTLNPFAMLRLPGSKGRKHLVALTEPQLRQLADVALDERMELGAYAPEYRAMILFAGYVGLRPGELFALRREDMRGQMATIERALSSRTGEIGATKNGRPRTVIVPPAAQDALLDVAPHPSGLLFTSPADRMWTQPLHHRYWSRLRLIANRPGLALYELRHCAATMLLERGASPWQAAVQLGHEDGGRLIQTLYGHPEHANIRQQLLALWAEDVKPLRPVDQRREESA